MNCITYRYTCTTALPVIALFLRIFCSELDVGARDPSVDCDPSSPIFIGSELVKATCMKIFTLGPMWNLKHPIIIKEQWSNADKGFKEWGNAITNLYPKLLIRKLPHVRHKSLTQTFQMKISFFVFENFTISIILLDLSIVIVFMEKYFESLNFPLL